MKKKEFADIGIKEENMAAVLLFVSVILIASSIIVFTEDASSGAIGLLILGIFCLVAPFMGNSYDKEKIENYISSKYENITFEKPMKIEVTIRQSSTWWSWKWMEDKTEVYIQEARNDER
jgi:hypothetical protein